MDPIVTCIRHSLDNLPRDVSPLAYLIGLKITIPLLSKEAVDEKRNGFESFRLLLVYSTKSIAEKNQELQKYYEGWIINATERSVCLWVTRLSDEVLQDRNYAFRPNEKSRPFFMTLNYDFLNRCRPYFLEFCTMDKLAKLCFSVSSTFSSVPNSSTYLSQNAANIVDTLSRFCMRLYLAERTRMLSMSNIEFLFVGTTWEVRITSESQDAKCHLEQENLMENANSWVDKRDSNNNSDKKSCCCTVEASSQASDPDTPYSLLFPLISINNSSSRSVFLCQMYEKEYLDFFNEKNDSMISKILWLPPPQGANIFLSENEPNLVLVPFFNSIHLRDGISRHFPFLGFIRIQACRISTHSIFLAILCLSVIFGISEKPLEISKTYATAKFLRFWVNCATYLIFFISCIVRPHAPFLLKWVLFLFFLFSSYENIYEVIISLKLLKSEVIEDLFVSLYHENSSKLCTFYNELKCYGLGSNPIGYIPMSCKTDYAISCDSKIEFAQLSLLLSLITLFPLIFIWFTILGFLLLCTKF